MQLINAERVLDTERLLLEPLQRRHAVVLFPLFQDPAIYRYIPQDPPGSVDALAERYQWLERRLSPAGDQAWLNWAVRRKHPVQYVGRVEATVLPDATAQLAYELASQFWGQGYATEACTKVVEVLFADYAVTVIQAEVDTRNAASIRLLERLGFRQVAYQPNVALFKGSTSDEYTYQLLAPNT